jgi:hypothetical protein
MSVLVAGHLDAEEMLAKYDNGDENDFKSKKNPILESSAAKDAVSPNMDHSMGKIGAHPAYQL